MPAPATNQRVCKDFALRPVPSCSAFSFHLPGPGRVRCCYPALSFAAMPQGFAALARGEARRQCGPRLPAPSLESRALKRCISSAVQGGGFTKSGSFYFMAFSCNSLMTSSMLILSRVFLTSPQTTMMAFLSLTVSLSRLYLSE